MPRPTVNCVVVAAFSAFLFGYVLAGGSSTIDALAIAQVAELFDDPLGLIDRAGLDVAATEVNVFVRKAGVVSARARARDYELLRELIVQVRVLATSVDIDISTAAIADTIGVGVSGEAGVVLTVKVPVRLTRSGMAMRLIQGRRSAAAEPDPALGRLIARARGYWLELRKGELNITQLAERDGISGAYITRLLRLAFLAPAVVEAILAGKQPLALTARTLVRTDAIDGDWREQAMPMLGAH